MLFSISYSVIRVDDWLSKKGTVVRPLDTGCQAASVSLSLQNTLSLLVPRLLFSGSSGNIGKQTEDKQQFLFLDHFSQPVENQEPLRWPVAESKPLRQKCRLTAACGRETRWLWYASTDHPVLRYSWHSMRKM